MAYEKLKPQDTRQSLVSQMNRDYDAAINYYNQRRQNISMLLQQKLNMTELGFQESINGHIENLWNKEVRNIMNGIYWGGKNNGVSAAMRQQQVEARFDTSAYLPYLIKAVSSDNPTVYITQMGNAFERFLQDKIFSLVLEKGSGFAGAHAEQLVSYFTGAMTSKGNTIEGIKNIRPDLLVSLSSITFDKKDGVQMSSTGLPLELQGELTIDYSGDTPAIAKNGMDEELLREFLTQKGDFFGFSAKTWGKDTNGKEFRQSSVMKTLLNQVFDQTDSKGKRHGWEYDYVSEYVAYFLAHNNNLYNIIGPTNVAMVTTQGITWMDDFLKTHIFYMRVQMSKKHGRQVLRLDNRAFPHIEDAGIYVRAHGGGTAIQGVVSKKHKTKRDGEYYDVRLKF